MSNHETLNEALASVGYMASPDSYNNGRVFRDTIRLSDGAVVARLVVRFVDLEPPVEGGIVGHWVLVDALRAGEPESAAVQLATKVEREHGSIPAAREIARSGRRLDALVRRAAHAERSADALAIQVEALLDYIGAAGEQSHILADDARKAVDAWRSTP